LLLTRISKTIAFTRSGSQLITRFVVRQNTRQGGLFASWWTTNDARSGQIRGRNAVSGTLSTLLNFSQARLTEYTVRPDVSRGELFEDFSIEAVAQ
jgi:hypothetical protein